MNARASGAVGTLIVFIGVLLVATIVSLTFQRVVHATTERSGHVGRQGSEQLRTVLVVTGVTAVDATPVLENLSIRVQTGSEFAVPLEDLVVLVKLSDATAAYRWSGSGAASVPTGEDGDYGAVFLEQGPHALDGKLTPGDLVELRVQLPRALQGGEQVRLSFVPADGLPSLVRFTLPSIITKRNLLVYP